MEQAATHSDSAFDYDVVVIGGSFAGLSAALQLARARRRVLVLDGGKPRNRFARTSNGFLGQDRHSPQEIMAIGLQQLLAYPTVQFEKAQVTGIGVTQITPEAGALEEGALEEGGFAVRFQKSISEVDELVRTRRLVLATGMTDHLPDIPGMQELWGTGVLHCPYCHGYEVADRKLAVFGIGPMSVYQAALVRDWSDDLTLLTNGGDWMTPEDREMLTARGVKLDEAPVRCLVPCGEELEAVEFKDGRRVPYGAMFTAARWSLAGPLTEQLGCETEETPFGPVVKTNMMKETTIPGVFAAGDMSIPFSNATLASAAGVIAGVSAHQSLLGLKVPVATTNPDVQSPKEQKE